ncbi:helix-turn-helix domain-containing protein [Evtepia sp.]|uniref:helix-turn-helix domain-containing protein n=1 Tax=Evtepia sp. TaxID=2773933 RepID=UPI00399AD7A8
MIGERLSEVRKDHGDTQSSLAKKLNVSVATVRSWEQEKSSPAHEILVNICKMYRVSSDYLLGLSNVDPSYIQRRRLESFTQQELEELAEYERFLLWRREQEK